MFKNIITCELKTNSNFCLYQVVIKNPKSFSTIVKTRWSWLDKNIFVTTVNKSVMPFTRFIHLFSNTVSCLISKRQLTMHKLSTGRNSRRQLIYLKYLLHA